MPRLPVNRPGLLLLGSLAAVLLIAVPVLGADPSAKPDAPGQAKQQKAAKAPEIALTLSGTVVKTTDAKGRQTFTMTVAGVTWELSAGPKWFWLDKNPLAAFVGKSVQVAGTHQAGENELDVDTVDGKALRASGKPPWAGGPKVLGSAHPGKGHGNGKAVGQAKDKTGADTDATDGAEAPDPADAADTGD
jgi:hypothetical protein